MSRENEQPGVMPEIVPALTPDDPGHPKGREIAELVRRRHPEVLANGLPPAKAIWFAIDREGGIRKSWIGPDLYINRSPSEIGDPLGSAEAQHAAAERERIQQEVIRANIPGMHVQGGYFVGVQGKEIPGFVAHFVTERPGDGLAPGTPIAAQAVGEAIRAELRRSSGTSP